MAGEVIEVELGDSPLGLRVETEAHGHVVTYVNPGGLAESHGVLPGDRLCAVDAVDVQGLSHEEAMGSIAKAQRPVVLIFRRVRWCSISATRRALQRQHS